MNLLVYGAGGHGKVVATTAMETLKYKKIYFLDPAKKTLEFISSNKIFSLNPKDISSIKIENLDSIIAVGDNKKRMNIASEYSEDNFVSVISQNSYVSSFVDISKGVFIAPGALINADSSIGCHSIINTGSIIEHDCRIGSFCHIAPNAALGGNVSTGSNVFIGGGSFVNPNISICSDVVIGSGSVVTNNVIESGVYAGVPIKKIK